MEVAEFQLLAICTQKRSEYKSTRFDEYVNFPRCWYPGFVPYRRCWDLNPELPEGGGETSQLS